jgi:hypothetical protein
MRAFGIEIVRDLLARARSVAERGTRPGQGTARYNNPSAVKEL